MFRISSDHENFYDGRLFGEVSSDARVHLEDGVMTATIHTPEEMYHIEVIILQYMFVISVGLLHNVTASCAYTL